MGGRAGACSWLVFDSFNQGQAMPIMAVQLVQSMSFLCRSKPEPIISVQLTDDTELAVSADGKKNWLVGVQTQMDDETSLKVRLGVKEDAGKEISCFLSRKLRPDFTITVTSAIQSKKLTDLNAHRLVRKWVRSEGGSGVGCFRVCVFGRSALVMAFGHSPCKPFSHSPCKPTSDSHELTAQTHPRTHRKYAFCVKMLSYCSQVWSSSALRA